MKANKLVVELFSLAILSGCLIACSKPTKEANTQSMQNMKVNRTNSNAKSNIFADAEYTNTDDNVVLISEALIQNGSPSVLVSTVLLYKNAASKNPYLPDRVSRNNGVCPAIR